MYCVIKVSKAYKRFKISLRQRQFIMLTYYVSGCIMQCLRWYLEIFGGAKFCTSLFFVGRTLQWLYSDRCTMRWRYTSQLLSKRFIVLDQKTKFHFEIFPLHFKNRAIRYFVKLFEYFRTYLPYLYSRALGLK